MGRCARGLCLVMGILAVLYPVAVSAAPPLHVQIVQAIEAKLDGQRAALSTDAEFVRRVYLDLTGMIPTASEARAFLDDPSPYKRDRLIDRLLDSPAYARRMQYVFDAMLMERRPDAHVPGPAWQEYLRKSFAENKPYNLLIREILAADGVEPGQQARAKFLLDREADPNLLTRDVGRLFLGIDVQCAQCHDHPLIDDYKQAHYYGIFAFLNRTSLFTDAKKSVVLAEKADGDVTFTSVFKKKVSHSTGPRLLDAPQVVEPKFAKGQEYLVVPAEKVRPVPAFSRRAQLAPNLTAGTIPEFNRNIANRLWALLMGRGLVQPLDLHHSDNPPSHPELLDLLAREFVAMHFDVKAFLRELALSHTYQSSSEPPPGSSAEVTEPARFAVAALKPLTPEQLAWSVMQATGLVAAARADVERQFETLDPKLRAILHSDPKRLELRDQLFEATVYQKLSGNVAPFVTRFGGAPGQAQDVTDPTVHQALFITNGQPIQSWLAPANGNLADRLSKLSDAPAMADELYLSLLSRRPTDEERTEVADHLAERGKERLQGIQELVWSLLACTEFRFNH